MSGVRYWRLKRRMTYTDLGKEAGCNGSTIRHLEDDLDHASYALLIRVADALGVTVDQLAEEYPEDAIGPGDHPAAKYTMDPVRLNPVGRFCREQNISLPEYAAMAGVRSRQAARRVWTKQKLKPGEILPLARLAGLSQEEFLVQYGKGAAA